MKRIASVSLVLVAFAVGTGCAAPVEPPGGTGESTLPVASSAAAAPSRALKPEMALARSTYWVALENGWSALDGISGQPYGAGAGGYANYSFPFPTPWLTWLGTPGQTNPVVDFDAWVYEHDYLVPIVSSNEAPAWEPYQWEVVQVTVAACTLPDPPPSGLVITAPCVESIVSDKAFFLVPFTDPTQEGALQTAEASEFGEASDVAAFRALEPTIYEIRTTNGQPAFGIGPGDTSNLLLVPIIQYPYADVHDPRTPPI